MLPFDTAEQSTDGLDAKRLDLRVPLSTDTGVTNVCVDATGVTDTDTGDDIGAGTGTDTGDTDTGTDTGIDDVIDDVAVGKLTAF